MSDDKGVEQPLYYKNHNKIQKSELDTMYVYVLLLILMRDILSLKLHSIFILLRHMLDISFYDFTDP